MQDTYLSIAKCLVYLKDVNNYYKINKGFFNKQPNFEGFNVPLSKVVGFDLHFLLNVSKEFVKSNSVKSKQETVFITYTCSDFTDLQKFVDNLNEYAKDIIPLIEEAISEYGTEYLKRIKGQDRIKGKLSKYNLPYGYSRTKQGNIVLDRTEANMALNVFRTYIRLRSMKKVAVALGGAGIVSRTGDRLDVGTVSDILHDNRYVSKDFIKIATVIPTSIFYKAQDTLRRNISQDSYITVKR